MLEGWWRERFVRKTLRKLSRQSVAMVMQPGNIWLIEKAVSYNEENHTALLTCYMRGWIEPIQQGVPSNSLNPDGSIPSGPLFTRKETLYRLTDSGWAVINRSHQLAIITAFLAFVAVLVAV